MMLQSNGSAEYILFDIGYVCDYVITDNNIN